jgi:hypothetical protein
MGQKKMMRDVSRLCVWLLAGGVSLLIFGGVTRAELPPSAYAKMQDDADEFVQIEVLQVRGEARRGVDEESSFTVTAKVVCRARSRADLKPGATITIGYSTVLRRRRGWAGPSSIGILKPGVYIAYLNTSDGIYTPAARGRSFIMASQRGPEPHAMARLC